MKPASDPRAPPRAAHDSAPKAPQHRERNGDGVKHMTDDGRSLVAGSGNTLGDGSTAGGTARKRNEKGKEKSGQ